MSSSGWQKAVVSQLIQLEESTPTTIVDAIIGSKKVRYGRSPSPENREHLSRMVEDFISQGIPIPFTTMWGATKGYDLFSLRCADLVDVQSLLRFAALNEQVKRFYTPGIDMKIVWGDVTEGFMAGNWSESYYTTFMELLKSMDLPFVSVVKEGSLIPDWDYWWHLVHANTAAIQSGNEKKIGWQGTIDWPTYLERARSELPDATEDELRTRISRYLAIVSARSSERILPGGCIRFSYCPYPDAVPDSFRRGRVEYKVKSSKNSNNSTPPWCGFGAVTENDWSVVPVKRFRTGNFQILEAEVRGYAFPVLVEG